jgi:hypothetical protein
MAGKIEARQRGREEGESGVKKKYFKKILGGIKISSNFV